MRSKYSDTTQSKSSNTMRRKSSDAVQMKNTESAANISATKAVEADMFSQTHTGTPEDASFSPLLICTYVHNTNRVILRSTYRVQHCSVGFLQSNARSARQGRSVREPEQIIGGHVEKESQLEYGGGGGLLLPRFPITYACIGKPECACKGVLPQTALDAKFPKALAEYL